MEKKFLVWGLIFGLLAVVIGAFGAHGLKSHLNLDQQLSFETGVRYQMYHALLLVLLSKNNRIINRIILNLVVFGIILFSGSIYLLNTKEIFGLEQLKMLGPITPVGGLLLISAWVLMIRNCIRSFKTT